MVAPHPDDETLGAGGLIAGAVAAGAAVAVVLGTDGNRRGLGRVRAREYAAALDCLGVPEAGRIRLNYADGSLARQPPGCVDLHLAETLSALRPDHVVLPAPWDCHPDHAVLGHAAAHWVQQTGVPCSAYPIHASGFPRPRGFRPSEPLLPPSALLPCGWKWTSLPLSPTALRCKLDALRCHRTQLWTPTLRGLLLSLVRQNELFAVRSEGINGGSP